MAAAPPTIEQFRDRFPELSLSSDYLVQVLLDEAAKRVGSSWSSEDQLAAGLYLAAHMVVMAEEQAAGGAIQSVSIAGAISITYRAAFAQSSRRSALKRTEYGINFMDIGMRYAGGPVVV